jgi:hypothetical protein
MGRFLSAGGAIGVLALLAFLWSANCTGPRPHVVSTQLQAPVNAGDPYIARAMVENRDGHGGSVSVQFRLLDSAGHRFEAQKTVQLESHEHLNVSAEIYAPMSDYRVKASVDYPVQ